MDANGPTKDMRFLSPSKKNEVSGRKGSVKRYEVLRGVNFENHYKPL